MFKTDDFLNASHFMFLFPFQFLFLFLFRFSFLAFFFLSMAIYRNGVRKIASRLGFGLWLGLELGLGHFSSGVIVLEPFETILHIFFHTCLYSTLFTQQFVHSTSHTMSWNHSRSHTMPVVAPSETCEPRSSMKLQIAKNQKNL